MRLRCSRRRCGLPLVSLLSSLAIFYSIRRAEVTQWVAISDTTTGEHPSNNHDDILEGLNQDIFIATPLTLRNVRMQLPGMSILGKSLDLRQDNTSQQEEKDVSPLDSEEHKVTLVGGGGNGGRGRGRVWQCLR